MRSSCRLAPYAACLGSRLRRLSGEAVRFSAVNIVATLLAVVLFNAFVHGVPMFLSPGPLNGWPATSWFIANCVGMGLSFYGSRRSAFRHRRASGPGGGFLNYALVNLASFVISMACLWVTRNVLHRQSALADNVSANVVGAALGTVFRFWAFRRFVFKKRGGLFQGRRCEHESARGPELRPHEPELLQHEAQQRQADAHDVVGVAGHAGHEGAAEAVEGEAPRHG
jgi:putative flippase GtrA